MTTGKKNILIIDDNAMTGHISLTILADKICRRLKLESIASKIKEEFVRIGRYDDAVGLDGAYGELLQFSLSPGIAIFFYCYHSKKTPEANADILTEVVSSNQINVVWSDREHVILAAQGDFIGPITPEVHYAEDLYEHTKLANALADQLLEQVAIITYNPRLEDQDILDFREKISRGVPTLLNSSGGGLDKIYFIETSTVFNPYEIQDTMPEDTATSQVRTKGYELYGCLTGHILADLFFELPGYATGDVDTKKYSYFNRNNRAILRYLKFLNLLSETYTRRTPLEKETLIKEKISVKKEIPPKEETPQSFQLGMISFYSEVFNKPNFLIDAPYKDYYRDYDERIKARGLLEIFNTTEQARYIFFRYFIEDEVFKYQSNHNLGLGKEDLLSDYLPYLHTGIFYDPDFYAAPFYPEDQVKIHDSEEWPANTVEIYYLFQQVSVGPINGVLHFSMWRRASGTAEGAHEKIVKNFWNLQYKLIEPKALEHLTPILLKEVVVQATRAAISQIMARNVSHNIASHVSYQATNSAIKKRFQALYPDLRNHSEIINDRAFQAWIDLMTGLLNRYEISRNEYVADYEQAPKNFFFYRDVVLPFCENTLILDNIASSEQIQYGSNDHNWLTIRCRIDKKEIKANYDALSNFDTAIQMPVQYPGAFPYSFTLTEGFQGTLEEAFGLKELSGAEDIEVTLHSEQAFYSILENVIRNSAKHNKETCQLNGLEIIIDIDNYNEHFYSVSIYDNVSYLSGQFLYNPDENQPGIYQRMHQGLIDEFGQIRKENWGYADMRINAFLFTHYADELADELLRESLDLIIEDDNGGFSTVNGPLSTGESYKFGFRFKVCKPKRILWIGPFTGTLDLKQRLQASGTDFIDFLYRRTEQRRKGIAAYQFAVISEEDSKDIRQNAAYLPGRLLVNNAWQLLQGPDEITNTEGLLIKCFERRLRQRFGGGHLFLHFEDLERDDMWHGQLFGDFSINTTNGLSDRILGEENRNVIFDHHGQAFQDLTGNRFLGVSETDFYFKDALVQVEKGSYDQQTFFYPPGKIEKQRLLGLELLDAALTNIFIIDERILRTANFEGSGFKEAGIPLPGWPKTWKMFAAGKVFVINQLNDHRIGDLGNHANIFKLNCKNGLNIDISNVEKPRYHELYNDVIVIHRTYIDSKFTGMNANDFLSLLSEHFDNVIITSGGGYPHSFSRNVKFIPFSVLEKFINLRLSKLRLNSLLQTVTQTSNE